MADRAGALGYRTRTPAQKAPFNSHGQVVFSNGKNYITPDVDGHNVTDGWKMFNRRGQRINGSEPMTQISTTSRNDGFSIEVIDDPVSEGATPSSSDAVARIRVGNFTETFLMDLSFWSVDEYRRSWESALREIECSEKATSCLIASITDPVVSNFISCWPMYRDGDVIHVQNSLIFLDELDEPFDPQEPWRYVEPHREVDEDGNRISEWVTSASEVRQFRESAWSL